MAKRDAAAEQLSEYKERAKKTILRTSWGAPVPSHTAVLAAGPDGPLLTQDIVFFDFLAHFDRERIPERAVHARGTGAFGYFECTHDITKYTKACMFSKIGKKTDLAARLSQPVGELGAADSTRVPRGFAVKFYTEEGIFDIPGFNSAMFFIRDPMLFPSLIHVVKRNPVTHLPDADAFWDFFSLRPESTHMIMFLFSDRGIPDGYRHMNGYGEHTYKLVNAEGEAFWCKFHFKTDQGVRNLASDVAARIAGTDPDYFIRDLYNAIHAGDFPSWSCYIQVMTFEQAKTYRYNIFDLTKVWSHKQFPLIPVGKLVLNRNPSNYFSDVEQIAFCPGHLIPGIEPSPDKMLQARILSYDDTQRHRLGPNHMQLPINCPYRTRVHNMQRDGFMAFENQDGAPNYYPNSFGGPEVVPSARIKPFAVSGLADLYEGDPEHDFEQPRELWRNVLSPDERTRLVTNIGGFLSLTRDFIQERAINNFTKVDKEFGQDIRDVIKKITSPGPKL